MKQIPNHPNYEITTDGRIWSKKNHRWLQLTLTDCGHYKVRLGSKQLYYVHRLVLETFIGPCPENMEGCHKNDIGTDNKLNNLRWGTRSTNRKDAVLYSISRATVAAIVNKNIWKHLWRTKL